jgi:hypothetical protein
VTEQGVRVVLELQRDEPISGRAFQGDRLIGTFTGWLELYSAIERAREARSDDERGGEHR